MEQDIRATLILHRGRIGMHLPIGSNSFSDQNKVALSIKSDRGWIDETGNWVAEQNEVFGELHQAEGYETGVVLELPSIVESGFRAGMLLEVFCQNGPRIKVVWRDLNRGGRLETSSNSHPSAQVKPAEPSLQVSPLKARSSPRAPSSMPPTEKKRPIIVAFGAIAIVLGVVGASTGIWYSTLNNDEERLDIQAQPVNCDQVEFAGKLASDLEVLARGVVTEYDAGLATWVDVIEAFDKLACVGYQQRSSAITILRQYSRKDPRLKQLIQRYE